MINTVLAVSAISVSIAALVIGSAALAFVIGLSRSTHQVVWKEASPQKDEVDPFQVEDEEPTEFFHNPNKRIKKETEDEDLVDLTDPSVSSGF